MPPLKIARQEAFAQGVASGKTHTQAYEDAGYKKDRQAAYKLHTRPAVKARIGELRDKAEQDRSAVRMAIEFKDELSRQWVIDTLMKNVKICMGELGKPEAHESSGANRSLELLGKELGMFIDRTESINTNFVISGSPDGDDADTDTDAESWAAKHRPN